MGELQKQGIRCGDHILHEPSGEAWVVAYVSDGRLICQGWPESAAKLEDCKVIYSCTDREHIRALLDCANASGARMVHARQELDMLGIAVEEPDNLTRWRKEASERIWTKEQEQAFVNRMIECIFECPTFHGAPHRDQLLQIVKLAIRTGHTCYKQGGKGPVGGFGVADALLEAIRKYADLRAKK